MLGRSLASLLVVSVVTAVAACDGDDPPPSGGGTSASSSSSSGATGDATAPTPGNVTDFCAETFGVILSAFDSCCSAADKETLEYSLTHGLVALVEPQCRFVLATSAGSGRLLYRADRAAACRAAYASTYGPGKCANLTATFEDPSGTACREAFVGTGAAGAGCIGDHECMDGLTCVGYGEAGEGKCSAPPALGEPCGPARVDGGGLTKEAVLAFGVHPSCAPGGACDDASGLCVAETQPPPEPPAPLAPAGSACTGSLGSGECAGRCDAKAGEPGTCVTFCGSR